MWALSWVIPAVVAVWVTGAVGRDVIHDVVSDEFGHELPAWLEGITPLKGRWLRCLLAAPVLAAFITCTFLAVIFLTWLVVLILFYAGLMLFGLLNA